MGNQTIKVLAVICFLLCLGTGVTYAAIVVTSNSVDVNPVDAPTLLLEVDNASPYVGETVTFTATLNPVQANVIVSFLFANGTLINSAQTSASGVASIQMLIESTESFQVKASCSV